MFEMLTLALEEWDREYIPGIATEDWRVGFSSSLHMNLYVRSYSSIKIIALASVLDHVPCSISVGICQQIFQYPFAPSLRVSVHVCMCVSVCVCVYVCV